MTDNATVATAALHDVASDTSAASADRVAAASTLLYAPSTSDAQPAPPTSPYPADHAAVALNAAEALVDAKYAAVDRKNEAQGVIAHIHAIAVSDLVEVEGFFHRILPFAITAAAALSIGLLVGHFA